MSGGELVRIFVACSLTAACSTDDGSSTADTVEGTPSEIVGEPRVSVGVLSGDTVQEFHQVTTPFLLAEGRLVVPLQGSSVIRVFDAEGQFLQSLGGPGEGPGEFANLRSAWPRGDTVEAMDSRLNRITRFLPDGEIEVIRLRGSVGVETAVPGAMPDGWVATAIGSVGSGVRDEVILHGFSMEGTHLGELGQIEGFMRIDGSGVAGPHPLSPRTVTRISGGEVYVAETETPRIQVLDLGGTVTREIEWEVDDRRAPDEALELVREAPLDAFYERLMEDAAVPDRLSVFWDFLVDDLGFIWIRPYEPGEHAIALGGGGREARLDGPWRILSADGVEVGAVEIPAGLRPAQITADALVGIWRDSLGVESVRVHDLRRN